MIEETVILTKSGRVLRLTGMAVKPMMKNQSFVVRYSLVAVRNAYSGTGLFHMRMAL